MSVKSKGIRDTQQAMAVIVDGQSQKAVAEVSDLTRYGKTGPLPGHIVLIAPHIAEQASRQRRRIRNFGNA